MGKNYPQYGNVHTAQLSGDGGGTGRRPVSYTHLIALLRLSIFGMCQGDKTRVFEDVKNRDPVLAGGFHADLGTGIFSKPGS